MRFLKNAFLFAMVLTFLPVGSSFAAAPIPVKFAAAAPPDFPVIRGMREVFKPQIEARTNGKYAVDIYDSGKFGTWEVYLQALQDGTLQLITESTANLSSLVPALSVLDIPFIAPNQKYYNPLLDSKPIQDILENFKKFGIICVAFPHNGPRVVYSRKQMKNLDEFKNFKIRSSASKIHNSTLKALGMNPTPMGFSEVYTAIQQGVVDGIDLDIPQGLILNYVNITPFIFWSEHMMIGHPIMANQKWWESGLPEEDRKIFREVMAETNTFIRNLVDSQIVENRKALEKQGMTIVDPDQAEIDRWVKATENVYKEFNKQIPEELVLNVRKEIANMKVD